MLALKVTTLGVASGDKMPTSPMTDPNTSTGSIDLGGAMLKMLHNTLGTRRKQIERDVHHEHHDLKDGAVNRDAETAPQDENTESREVENISEASIDNIDSSHEKSTNDKSSETSGSVLDLSESSSASIDSILVRSLQLDDIKNITTSDGRLDTEKLANLPFPQVNISKSLEKSFAELKSSTSKKPRGPRKKDNLPPHSTPVSTVTDRRPTRHSKRHADEKEKMNALLRDLNI